MTEHLAYHTPKWYRRHLIHLLVALIIGVVSAVFAVSPSTRQAALDSQPGLVPVTYVDDGDTIKVQLSGKEETVRLLGIDTPEVKDPRKPVQCYGEIASEHTKSMLNGKSIRLASDPQDTDRDKYGRLLRYIYLPDGTLYNAELVRDGYAFAYTVFPIAKLDEFKSLEAEARSQNRGLWAACQINESSQIKQTAGSK